MKKWSGIALLLVLVMSVLAACGGNNERMVKMPSQEQMRKKYSKSERLRTTLLSNTLTQRKAMKSSGLTLIWRKCSPKNWATSWTFKTWISTD